MTINLDDLAPLAWTQFWQLTLVAMIAGGVARFVCRNSPRLAYALWMLVVVKALTPPLWSSPTGVFSWALAVQEMPLPALAEDFPAPIVVSRTPVATIPVDDPVILVPDEQVSSETVLLWLWGAGLVGCLMMAIGKQSACWILLRRSRLPVRGDLISMRDDLRRRLGIRRRVRLIVSARPIGPAAFGLLRPTIVLPEILLSGKTSEQVELILAHELVHIKRGDVLAGHLQLAAQVIWWFHPLMWWANREATRERERCCDRDVVEGVGCRPAAYARTLLSVVELKSQLRIPAAIPGVRAMEVTSQRLETIMRFQRGRGKGAWLPRVAFACGAILLVPGAGLTLQAEADEKPRRRIVTEMTLETKATEEIKKAEDELRWAEGMYEKKYVKKARLEEARLKLLKLKVSALEEEILRGRISLAKSDLARAKDRLDVARRMEEKGILTKNQRIGEERELQQAKVRFELAGSKLTVYLRYTKPKMERAERDLDEGTAAERLARAARPKEDGAKTPPTKAVQETSSPKEAKSEWQQRAEKRVNQAIAAIRNELSLAEADVKRGEDRVDWASKMREKGYVSEAQLKKEKLALRKAKDQLKDMEAKLKELSQALNKEKPEYLGAVEIVEGDDGQLVERSVGRKLPDMQTVKDAMKKKGFDVITGGDFADIANHDRTAENNALDQTLDQKNEAEAEKSFKTGAHYKKIGRVQAAEYHFGKILEKWPQSPWAKKAKTELASLAKMPRTKSPQTNKQKSGITLKGVACEKGTGRPIEGAKISFDEKHEAVTGKDGRYEFVDLPEAQEYSLVGGPKTNEPYFITSAKIKPPKGEKTINLDLEFVRGIPFRVRVIDKDTGKPLLDPVTGKPLRGGISYFPVAPNDPYQRGALGYSRMSAESTPFGAHYETGSGDEHGEYRGAVLSGPGVLCFSTGRSQRPNATDHKPIFVFPDGEKAVRLFADDVRKLYMVDLPIQGRSDFMGLVLNRYTAVIAINPKDDAKEVSYEIKLDQAEALK